ncbi:MAG: ammonium transporter [Gammaproteobacteria bacterium]|nr:ammonium transporter [Gammaproteobacteria bacterium]
MTEGNAVKRTTAFAWVVAAGVAPAVAFAEVDSGDTAWLLTSTVLVLFMTLPGLALFYGGLVRSKNVLSVLMQCFALACLMTLVWVAIGYGLSFGNGGSFNRFIGGGNLLLSGLSLAQVHNTVPETVFLMFQMTFAIITPALIIGGFAERMKFATVLVFSVIWLLLVYAPVCHWVWGGGWLAERGFYDFAGGTVVHINAGVASIVAAKMIGRRRGFPATAMPPHNLTLTMAGASMLWVGWFGFNAGSAVAADANAGMAMLVTHIAAASGSMAWMSMEWVKHGKPSVLGIVTGMVAGLGAITPASGYVGPMGALLIGVTAGIVCYFATQFIKRSLRIDDALDVFPVHGVGGMMGTLFAGLLAVPMLGGVGMGRNSITGVQNSLGEQVLLQFTGVVATVAWCGVLTWILLRILDATMGLRVSPEQETQGLDLAEHDERGYIL